MEKVEVYMPHEDGLLTYNVGEECEKGIVIDIQVQVSPLLVVVTTDGGIIRIAGAPFYATE